MDKNTIIGSTIGILGNNNNNNTITQQLPESLDIGSLGQELSLLREIAKQRSSSGEHDIEIGKIAAAEQAAKNGDRSQLTMHLKSFGKWTTDLVLSNGGELLRSIV